MHLGGWGGGGTGYLDKFNDPLSFISLNSFSFFLRNIFLFYDCYLLLLLLLFMTTSVPSLCAGCGGSCGVCLV